jgi:hypothetical protein
MAIDGLIFLQEGYNLCHLSMHEVVRILCHPKDTFNFNELKT